MLRSKEQVAFSLSLPACAEASPSFTPTPQLSTPHLPPVCHCVAQSACKWRWGYPPTTPTSPQASYSSLPIELPRCSGCGDSNLSLEVQFGYGFLFFLWYVKWPTSHTVTAVAVIQPTVSPAQLKLQHRLWWGVTRCRIKLYVLLYGLINPIMYSRTAVSIWWIFASKSLSHSSQQVVYNFRFVQFLPETQEHWWNEWTWSLDWGICLFLYTICGNDNMKHMLIVCFLLFGGGGMGGGGGGGMNGLCASLTSLVKFSMLQFWTL